MNKKTVLKLEGVQKTYNQADETVAAVQDAHMEVYEGEFVSIVGRSGSGKSTLLSLLGTLDTPTDGSIEIGERDITKLPSKDLLDFRRREIGFVFQNYNLIPNLTALENVMLPMEYASTPKEQRQQRAQELLDEVGIYGDKQQRKPGRLSGGEQQRVSVARALANQPKLLLADEPTGNLDSENGAKVFSILHDLTRNKKTTVVVVTHDLDIAGKTDKIFTLNDGILTLNKKK